MWVITGQYNDYDQHGGYFVAAFNKEPTRSQLLKLFYKGDGENKNYSKEQHVFINHLSKGGGRIGNAYCWYYLSEVKEGISYED